MTEDLKNTAASDNVPDEETSGRVVAEERLVRMNRLYSMLSEMNKAIVRIRDRERLYNETCRIAVETGRFRMAWAGLVDWEAGMVRPVSSRGFVEGYLDGIRISTEDVPEGRGPTGTVIRTGEHFVCTDIEHDPRLLPWREKALERGYRSSAAFPIRTDGRVTGAFMVYSEKRGDFDEEEVRLLDGMAEDISFALETLDTQEQRKRAEESLKDAYRKPRRREAEIFALLKSSRVILGQSGFMDSVKSIFGTCKGLIGATAGYVSVFGADGMEDKAVVLDNGGTACRVGELLPAPVRGIRAKVCRTGVAAYENDFPNSGWAGLMPDGHKGLESVLFAPLTIAGKVGGLMGFANKPGGFSEHDALVATTFGEFAASALYNSRILEELDEHRARLEGTVRLRTAGLTAANKDLEAFAYSVSHDLRAPLRGMDSFSKALLEDYSDSLDERGKDYLKRIRAAGEHMAQLIDCLLKLSMVAREEMRRETVNLSDLAKKIAAELRAAQPGREVEFVVEDGVEGEGDAALLGAVMENLIGNAFKFTSKRPDARIEFLKTVHDGCAAYCVRDNGVGFDMTYAGKLFIPFQRLHSPSEFPGMGIGLATVQRIIRRHGGRVWAEAEAERGATVYFTL